MIEQISKIDTGFKITIPTKFRKLCNLNAGSYVKWIIDENNLIIIKPVKIVESD